MAVEGAAYGEVVWFWHPWLMSSQRRRVGPTGLKTNLNPLATVTKKEFVAGKSTSREVSRKAIAQGMPDWPAGRLRGGVYGGDRPRGHVDGALDDLQG